jgi:glucosamine-phosphate N-acetyltransferase
MLKIRVLTPRDWDSYLNCLSVLSKVEHSFGKFLENFERRKSFQMRTFVAEKDDKIVGTVSVLIEPKFSNGFKSVAHLEDVAVRREYQGQGIAKALIEEAIKYAKKKDCYKVILDCDDSLINFYEGFDFVVNGVAMRLDL